MSVMRNRKGRSMSVSQRVVAVVAALCMVVALCMPVSAGTDKPIGIKTTKVSSQNCTPTAAQMKTRPTKTLANISRNGLCRISFVYTNRPDTYEMQVHVSGKTAKEFIAKSRALKGKTWSGWRVQDTIQAMCEINGAFLGESGRLSKRTNATVNTKYGTWNCCIRFGNVTRDDLERVLNGHAGNFGAKLVVTVNRRYVRTANNGSCQTVTFSGSNASRPLKFASKNIRLTAKGSGGDRAGVLFPN